MLDNQKQAEVGHPNALATHALSGHDDVLFLASSSPDYVSARRHVTDAAVSAHAWLLQVLWPRLVANKLFRKTSGSHAFVTDFPVVADDDQVLDPEFGDGGCSPDADASRCVKRPRPQERSKTLKYKYVRIPVFI